jgi:hypothetical protein
MLGLVPGIHAFLAKGNVNGRPSPAMTNISGSARLSTWISGYSPNTS